MWLRMRTSRRMEPLPASFQDLDCEEPTARTNRRTAAFKTDQTATDLPLVMSNRLPFTHRHVSAATRPGRLTPLSRRNFARSSYRKTKTLFGESAQPGDNFGIVTSFEYGLHK